MKHARFTSPTCLSARSLPGPHVTGAESTLAAQKLAVENSRLGIPLIFGYDVIHGYKTIFPVPLGEAASWDLEAIETSARVAATEAAAAGLHWTFGPMVDIARDARWGRIMEGGGVGDLETRTAATPGSRSPESQEAAV